LAFGVWRLAFGVWRLAFGVWRVAFGVWRLAFGVWRLAFGVWRLAFGVWRLAFGVILADSPNVEAFIDFVTPKTNAPPSSLRLTAPVNAKRQTLNVER
jgi:hypothetical protein